MERNYTTDMPQLLSFCVKQVGWRFYFKTFKRLFGITTVRSRCTWLSIRRHFRPTVVSVPLENSFQKWLWRLKQYCNCFRSHVIIKPDNWFQRRQFCGANFLSVSWYKNPVGQVCPTFTVGALISQISYAAYGLNRLRYFSLRYDCVWSLKGTYPTHSFMHTLTVIKSSGQNSSTEFYLSCGTKIRFCLDNRWGHSIIPLEKFYTSHWVPVTTPHNVQVFVIHEITGQMRSTFLVCFKSSLVCLLEFWCCGQRADGNSRP